MQKSSTKIVIISLICLLVTTVIGSLAGAGIGGNSSMEASILSMSSTGGEAGDVVSDDVEVVEDKVDDIKKEIEEKSMCDGSFSDVPCAHANSKAVYYLKEQGVINGYPDGSFKPDQIVNRAEIVKFALLSRGIDLDEESNESGFPDVKMEEWYAKYVVQAKKLGWIAGHPDGNYRPADPVNRVAILKILFSAYNFKEVVAEELWSDTPLSEWYAGYLQFAKDNNIIEARADGMYHPSEGMTRAEVAETMYRVIKMIEAKAVGYGSVGVNATVKNEQSSLNEVRVRARVINNKEDLANNNVRVSASVR